MDSKELHLRRPGTYCTLSFAGERLLGFLLAQEGENALLGWWKKLADSESRVENWTLSLVASVSSPGLLPEESVRSQKPQVGGGALAPCCTSRRKPS